MTSENGLPHVLFLTSHAFNHSTGGGVTFSNLFAGWPKDRLACLHNDPMPPETDVCDRYFRLGARELGKWGLFRLLQRDPAPVGNSIHSGNTPPQGGRLFSKVRSALFGNNEFPESARLTPELESWIEDFSPQVLYTILGSNGFMELIELIRTRFNLPLVVHVMDDWRATSHTRGMLAPLRRHKMQRHLAHLMALAERRMGISDTMCLAYEADYGRPFETFHNGIDITAQDDACPPNEKATGTPFSIFYGGAVLPFAQLQSLIDVCLAVAELAKQGMPVKFDIYCPPALTDPHREKLLSCEFVHLHPPIADRDDYMTAMRGADLLLLPVNFEDRSVKFIRYSMPTKVPELMQSGVPVLVYGPSGVAQVDYALDQEWGYTVTEQGVQYVSMAIKKLAADSTLRSKLVDRARGLARKRHDIAKVRDRFRAALADAATAKASEK